VELAFLPNGDMLVTERRPAAWRWNGVPDPQSIRAAANSCARAGGLMDVVLHPRFGENKLIYCVLETGREGARRWRWRVDVTLTPAT
jgi:glucose/arabinose dehydrogenase